MAAHLLQLLFASASHVLPAHANIVFAPALGTTPPAGAQRPLRQRGQGSVEFLLAAVPVLLLGLGSIEALHWHFTRQAVSLALALAARATITSHADPQRLDEAFALALLPFYGKRDDPKARERLAIHMARRERATGLPAWNLRIISPSQASFDDFKSTNPDLPHGDGLPVIDNDYILEQHQLRVSNGSHEGRGLTSGHTILEANTLVVHLTWLHEPLLPGVRQLMRQLAPEDKRYGSTAMRRGGYLPMRREVAMVMQSHPIAWKMPPHRRVTRNAHPDEAEPLFEATAPGRPASSHDTRLPQGHHPVQSDGTDPGADTPTWSLGEYDARCRGLWCLREGRWSSNSSQETNGWREAGGNEQRGDQQPGDPGAVAVDQRRGDPDAVAGDPAPGAGDDPEFPDLLDDCPGCC